MASIPKSCRVINLQLQKRLEGFRETVHYIVLRATVAAVARVRGASKGSLLHRLLCNCRGGGTGLKTSNGYGGGRCFCGGRRSVAGSVHGVDDNSGASHVAPGAIRMLLGSKARYSVKGSNLGGQQHA